MNLKEALRDELTGEELGHLQKSFDVIGDVCIIEIPEELVDKKERIADALLEIHKHVKTVYNKKGNRKGVFRLRDMELLRGKHHKTIHAEHGCRFALDVREAYFSPREGTERQRISEQVEPGETALVMFAGIGPYAIMIGKKSRDVGKVYGIEINEKAFGYFEENVRINKVQEKVIPVLGDVKEKCRDLRGSCDRVIMPLPEGAYQYLPEAIRCLKPEGGTIHFYCWVPEGKFDKAGDIVRKAAEKAGKSAEIINIRKVLPYKPRTHKVCVDAKVK